MSQLSEKNHGRAKHHRKSSSRGIRVQQCQSEQSKVRDETDGKSDETEGVRSRKETSCENGTQVSENADFTYETVLKTSRP